MLYWCGKRKTNIELGAGVEADFDLPDLTNTLDGLVVQLFVLISKVLTIRIQEKSKDFQTSSQESAHLVRFFRLLLKEPVCWLL